MREELKEPENINPFSAPSSMITDVRSLAEKSVARYNRAANYYLSSTVAMAAITAIELGTREMFPIPFKSSHKLTCLGIIFGLMALGLKNQVQGNGLAINASANEITKSEKTLIEKFSINNQFMGAYPCLIGFALAALSHWSEDRSKDSIWALATGITLAVFSILGTNRAIGYKRKYNNEFKALQETRSDGLGR